MIMDEENPSNLNARLKVLTAIKAMTNVPKSIFDQKIKGCVFVHYKINNDGIISDVETHNVFTNEKNEFVERDFKECEKEAIRILHALPKDLLKSRQISDGRKFIPVNFPTKNPE